MDTCENLDDVENTGELGKVYVNGDGTRHYALGHKVIVGYNTRRILCTLCCDAVKKHSYLTAGWGRIDL